jgi:hypothetical protein
VSSVEVTRRAFGRLAALSLDIEVDRLVVRALRAAAPETRRVLVQAGLDAGLCREDTINRAATCFLASSAFNLSDDLSDDDCDYLPSAPAQAVVLILHSLFLAGLRDLHLPSDVEAQVLQDLFAAEEAQVLETVSTSWNATRLGIVTDGIAGSQWSAYLRIMWAGTRMEHLSTDVARNFGRVALLAGDITTADPRYNTLPRADRRSVLKDALTSLHALESVDTQIAQSVVAECGPVLAEEFADVSVSNTASTS